MGIASSTGLGNPSPVLLKNQLTNDISFNKKIKKMLSNAIKQFPLMKKYNGCDFEIRNGKISFGIEPAYQYEHLELVCIQEDKNQSYQQRGYAHGAYGSDIASTMRFYKDYKYRSKFTKFVDKWHSFLFHL